MIVAVPIVAVSIVYRSAFAFTNVVAGITNGPGLNHHNRRRRASDWRRRANHRRTRNYDSGGRSRDNHGRRIMAMIIADGNAD
jgi:hypothetical protein